MAPTRFNGGARGPRQSPQDRKQAEERGDALDKRLGFPLLSELVEQEIAESAGTSSSDTDTSSKPRLGWLLNFRNTTLTDALDGSGSEASAIELYFLQQDNQSFKTRIVYKPYFYVHVADGRGLEVLAFLQRRLDGLVSSVDRVKREDLDIPNHLGGKRGEFLQLSFRTVSDLLSARSVLQPIIERNKSQQKSRQAYGSTEKSTKSNPLFQFTNADDSFDVEMAADAFSGMSTAFSGDDTEAAILELREYDVPYAMRAAIDLDIRVGAWYNVTYDPSAPYSSKDVTRLPEMLEKAEPVVCAFDIECSKAPLKFPDATADQIYMISYVIDGQGYLITNREIVTEDVPDFEYTPKEDYPGPFIVFNEANEKELLQRFLDHMLEAQPHIFVTYNGDFFDWPFMQQRFFEYGISLEDELGIFLDQRTGEFRGRCSVHLDAFCWVKRDSYLPQGSQGLKAVTKYKLGYDPVEVDPEEMLPLAQENPRKMAAYSVSDALATFYLYDKYVHLFVFSLCTIIPIGSEGVLRKGSGALCEALLMVEAYKNSVISPNKQSGSLEDDPKFYNNHLVENETYVGGHVECLESGVFRADFEYDFKTDASAYQELIDRIDRDLTFALEVEMNTKVSDVANYNEIRQQIVDKLQALKNKPTRKETPLIYHLDVAAMYPNIILTNRMQPWAIVNEADCAACAFNTECGKTAVEDPDQSCQREMNWVWRGDYTPATRHEYNSLKTQLEYENFPSPSGDGNVKFDKLPKDQRQKLLKQRLKSYSSSVYKKTKLTTEEKRSVTVCMRENSFYVETVRAFRDRRYEYKGLTKTWKKKQGEAAENGDALLQVEAGTKALVYDSLQLAHKCILNSFYGYVMSKGARWRSMEMAGIVTHTGANLIKGARELVERIGRPLELDTDGIWAILPSSFPEDFTFKLTNGGDRKISYPCVMLNADVDEKFSNRQYHVYDSETGEYKVERECSISFEVDGPYKAMVLPASTDEGRLLKKRYAVFNFDHTLAELKGFELKRRGELQLIKAFQGQVFDKFLDGSNLQECYNSVATCAAQWLDVIDCRGKEMSDQELLHLITESKNMSNRLADYAGQKSTAITTAKRLGEFLGQDMVQDKGLRCEMVIANRPVGEKVTERAIPTAIFAAEPAVRKHYLRRWLGDPNLTDFTLRSVLDWGYYRQRFASTVQKIISLPAAFQHISNPVPRIELPDWMRRRVREAHAKFQQGSIRSFVQKQVPVQDVEDLFASKQQPRISPKKVLPEEEQDVSLGEAPFNEWLKNRKQKWKRLVERRKRKRDEHSNVVSKRRDVGIGMENFVTDLSSSLQTETWQVVEIQPDADVSGRVTCWVLTSVSRRLHRVTLKLPRTLYLSLISDEELDVTSRRVMRVLPRGGSKPQQLLEVQLGSLFHERDASAILTDSRVSAAYEAQTSPLTRAVCSLGGAVTLSNRHLSLRDGVEVDVHDLHQTQSNALSDWTSFGLRTALLYIAQQKQRAIIGLVLLTKQDDGTFAGDASVWIVDPVSTQRQSSSDLDRMFATLQSSILSSCSFTTFVAKDMTSAFSRVNQALAVLRDEPTFVVAQSNIGSRQRLRHRMQGLYAFPLATLSFVEEDGRFPALTWRKILAERFVSRAVEMTASLQELSRVAQYAHMPVGNLTGDPNIAALDVLYSRLLSKHQHVWWHSPSPHPDLGGKEQELLEVTEEDPVVTNKGSFDTFCVELEVDGLAVGALLVATQLEEMEGSSKGAQIDAEDGEEGSEALRHLRSLVTSLFKDVVSSKNPVADGLLQHVYRWICSSQALSYDPLLKSHVKRLMKKLFLHLIAELGRLGATIVHADSSKLLLCTGQKTQVAAERYLTFVLGTLAQQPLFQVLSFTTSRFYSHLLFLDAENYGGMVNDEIISQWDLARHLPPGVDDYLLLLIGQFLRRRVAGVEVERLVSTYLTEKLLRLVPEIASSDFEFPVLVGSHLSMDDAALELVKSLCAVLSLDSTAAEPVSRMKRTLLRLLHTSEFSDDAPFANPSRSLLLPDVICVHCNLRRTIDLCRDSQLEEDEPWKCTRCHALYDVNAIEMWLVEKATAKSLQYQLQDPTCSRCQLPMESKLQLVCTCAGDLGTLATKRSEMEETLEVLHRLGKKHGFEYLVEVVERLQA